jgi:Flp pilus assembly protein TadB
MSEAREFMLAVLGISSGFIIPLGVFLWLYKDAKNKRAAIVEIAKTANDPSRVQEFLDRLESGDMFSNKKSEPIDYKRNGVITLFVGVGLYLFGVAFVFVLKGVGLLVGSIGVGLIIAGYFFPDDSVGITKAVEDFEKE